MQLNEGGNAFPNAVPVAKKDVANVVATAKRLLPKPLLARLQTDIGSAGYKVESGDIDLMVEAEDVVALFQTQNEKDPIKTAKKSLENYFIGKGIDSVVKGNNVHIGIPYGGNLAQVDVMVVGDAALVAPYHQHGPRGSYDDPEFVGNQIFILMNSIGKPLGLKFDAFGARLMRRDDNTVVARDRDAVAKILLNPKATADDLNSVKSIMRALENDPMRDQKLAQALGDEAKGLLSLPKKLEEGSASWFRQMQSLLVK
jgi:hypothetical protein